MEESAKKHTKVSNLEKMSPEKRARAEAFLSDEFGQMMVDNLKRNLKKKDEEEKREKETERNKQSQPKAEPELREAIVKDFGSGYYPGYTLKSVSEVYDWLHWVRETLSKYAAEKSAEEKKSQGQ